MSAPRPKSQATRPASGLRGATPLAKPAAPTAKGGARKGSAPPPASKKSTPPAAANDAAPPALSLSLPTLLLSLSSLRFDAELHSFLCSLAVMVEQVERTTHSQAAFTVATAVRGIIVVAANYLANKGRGKLTASSEPLRHLSFLEWSWRGGPVEVLAKRPGRAETDHSDPMDDLLGDVTALLTRHAPRAGEETPAPVADLLAALTHIQVTGRQHQLYPHAGHTRSLAAALTPTDPTAADQTMRRLGSHLLDLHGYLRHVQDETLGARHMLRDATRQAEKTSGETAGLADIGECLDRADQAFWHVLSYLGNAVAEVAGSTGYDSLSHNIDLLASLVDALGGPELSYRCDPKKARKSWFATPSRADKP